MATSPDPASVSVLVVNFNGEAVLARFLAGIAASEVAPLEVIVVDNASADGSVALLQDRADVRLVASDENLGFGRGCNLGARDARGDLLLLANPDVALEPDTIGALVRGLQTTPGAAICTIRGMTEMMNRIIGQPRGRSATIPTPFTALETRRAGSSSHLLVDRLARTDRRCARQ